MRGADAATPSVCNPRPTMMHFVPVIPPVPVDTR
jgi:hypothetical protein